MDAERKPAAACAPAAAPRYTGCNGEAAKCNALHHGDPLHPHLDLTPRQQELYREVASIVFALRQQGVRPTNAAVRERLGSGSMSTIAPVLHAVLEDEDVLNAEKEIGAKACSEFVNSCARALLDFLYAQRVLAAEEKVQGVLGMYRESQELSGIHIDELAGEIERQKREVEGLGKDLKEAQEMVAGLVRSNSEKDREIASLKARLEEAPARKELQALVKEIASLLGKRSGGDGKAHAAAEARARKARAEAKPDEGGIRH